MLKFLFAISLAVAIHADPIFRLVTVRLDGLVTQSLNSPAFPVGGVWNGSVQWSIPDVQFKAGTFYGNAYDGSDCIGGNPDPSTKVCFAGYLPPAPGQAALAHYEISATGGALDFIYVDARVTGLSSADDTWALFFNDHEFAFSYWVGGSPMSSPDFAYSGTITNTRLFFEPEPGTGLLACCALGMLTVWRLLARRTKA